MVGARLAGFALAPGALVVAGVFAAGGCSLVPGAVVASGGFALPLLLLSLPLLLLLLLLLGPRAILVLAGGCTLAPGAVVAAGKKRGTAQDKRTDFEPKMATETTLSGLCRRGGLLPPEFRSACNPATSRPPRPPLNKP